MRRWRVVEVEAEGEVEEEPGWDIRRPGRGSRRRVFEHYREFLALQEATYHQGVLGELLRPGSRCQATLRRWREGEGEELHQGDCDDPEAGGDLGGEAGGRERASGACGGGGDGEEGRGVAASMPVLL